MNSQEPDHAALSPNPAKPDRPGDAVLTVARLLVLIAGLGIAGLGLSCSAAGLLGTLLSRAGGVVDDAAMVQNSTLYAGVVMVTVTLGLALAWHAWRASQGWPSARFSPPPAGPLLLLFLLALAAGQLVLSLDLLPALTFPLAHVIVAVMPPLTILALAGRALGNMARWRTITLQIASGAFVATTLAFALEGAVLLVLLGATMAAVAMQPGGEQLLTGLADSLSRLQIQDPNALLDLLNLPLVAAGALVVIALVVPLLEELIKTVGIGLMAYRRPGKAQAILWGVSAGAGFSMMEGLFNTLTSLDAWALVGVLRIGATLLHCFTGALMGLAWHQALARRPWPVVGLYAGSVAMHAAWNALSVGMTLVSFDTGGGGSMTPDTLLAGSASVGLFVLLVMLAVGMTAGLVLLVRRARQQEYG